MLLLPNSLTLVVLGRCARQFHKEHDVFSPLKLISGPLHRGNVKGITILRSGVAQAGHDR